MTRKLKKALFSQWGTTEGKEQMKSHRYAFLLYRRKSVLSRAKMRIKGVFSEIYEN